jgi:thiamine-phosphate pyrophosphorylase
METELPKLQIIVDRFTNRSVAERCLKLVGSAPVSWIRLRDHEAETSDFQRAGRRLVAAVRETSPETLISISGAVLLASELNLGLHVGWRDPAVEKLREIGGADMVIGRSVHSDLEVTEIGSGVDYLLVSPIFDSISKPDLKGKGLTFLRSCVDRTNKPVYALGGISTANLRACLDSGAAGVAVLGGIMDAEDPSSAARAYLEALA